MPTFLDFLSSPWRLLDLLGVTAPSPSPAPSPAAQMAAAQLTPTPAGPLCSLQDVSGEMLRVCRFGGYEIPAFVFWASCLIFILFLASSLWLLWQCFQLTRFIDRATRIVERALGRSSSRIVHAQFRALDERLSFDPHFGASWKRFAEGVVEASPGELYCTEPIEDVLSRSAIVDDHLPTAFFNALPGILTGLGLLMTFVAILDGLSHVTVTNNMDVTGIGGLINGLSGKFFSSIVAVTCAVLFVFVERFTYGLPYRAHRRLLGRLASRFRRRTSEHLLQGIQSQLSEQAEQQRELTRTLGELRATIAAAGGRPRGQD